MALLVVSLGAYTRLKDAGLGCPDWPGCYGKWIVPTAAVDTEKAWIEMIHRYAAGLLGVGILCIAWLSTKGRVSRFGLSAWFPWSLVALVGFQAALGMWTVTLRLYPIVVMGHLLGGVLISMGLAWWFLSLRQQDRKQSQRIVVLQSASIYRALRSGVYLSLGVLLIQLMLGGWISANYAALVCLDFPLCQGWHNPPSAWLDAFNFLQAGNPAVRVCLYIFSRVLRCIWPIAIGRSLR